MKFKISATILLILMLAACGGRLPTTAKTQSILRHHFQKYGKKYKESPFHNKKITNIEVLKMDEIHKNLIVAQSFVTIEGPEVFQVRMTIEKGPFGWRYVSWENLSGE